MLLRSEEAVDISRIRWQRDLWQETVQREWYYTHKYIRFISFNIAIRENVYKLRHR